LIEVNGIIDELLLSPLERGDMGQSLGFLGIHSLEVCVRFTDDWIQYLVDGFGFQYIAKSTPGYEKQVGYATYLLQCQDCRIVLMEAKDAGSPVARFLERHPEGISHVNYIVKDVSAAESFLAGRQATFQDFIRKEDSQGGSFRHFSIATPVGDVSYRFVEVTGRPECLPGQEVLSRFDPGYNPLGLVEIDHLTTNTRTLQPLISWYKEVLGLEPFWDVQFHTEDLKPGIGTGLKSIVVWDAESKRVKLANNEPLRPRFDESQIQIYVDDNHGPGIQHVAFKVRDLIATVEYCSTKKIDFLPTPAAYYDQTPARISERKMGPVRESLEDLRRLSLLIDGEDGGYLLQIFCKDQASQFGRPDAGPLFIELIQRCGSNGFGEGNFRALFESIERAQQGK
jgi:4-hydroxyphenylpyruvate dioxygenase